MAMEITIFAKRRQTKEGKNFTTYLSTLTKKNGERTTVSVRFREECPAPKPEQCPCNIIIEKDSCNLSQRQYVDTRSGEIAYSSTLWVSAYKLGAEYVDTSMDEYM